MSMGDDTDSRDDHRGVSRRNFVKAAGASGASGVAAGLAGCLGFRGGGGGGGGGTTVQWGFDPTVAQNKGKKIKQLFHDAGLSKDISIEFFAGSQKTGNRRQKYTQILKAGEESPDILGMDNGWTIPFIVRGLIANLSEELSEDRLNRVDNQYFNTFTSTARHPETGELWAMPFRPGFPVMHYRKDLVKQAGYKPDKEGWTTNPMTWKRFAKITKDVRDQTGTKYGFSFQFDAYVGLSCCTFNEFMSSWGGAYFGGRKYLFGPVGERPVSVAKKPVQKSVRMVRTFIHGQNDPEALSGYTGSISPAKVLSWIEPASLKPFVNGNAVMLRYWPTAIAQTLTAENAGQWAKPENYGTMPIPYAVKEANALEPGTGGTTSALGGWHMTLNPNAAHKEAALEVIKTAMTKQVQIGLFDLAGWLPPDIGVFTSKQARQVKPMGNHLETLKLAGQNAMPRPVTIAWPEEATAIFQKVNPAAAQKLPTEQALTELDGRLTNIENSVSSS